MNIVILGPEQRNQNIFKFLKKKGNKVFITEDHLNIDYLKDRKIDWMICNGYSPIINKNITDQYHKRIINIHPAYIPQGRGIFPNYWSYFKGFKQGSTLHYINSGIDTGDIIARAEIEITDNETLHSSNQKLLDMAEKLFFKHWDEIITGKITGFSQPDQGNTNYYRRIDSEALIELLPERWNTKVSDVEEIGADFLLSTEFWNSYFQEHMDK